MISPHVFLQKGVLKISSKFTGEHPYQSVISIHFFFRTSLDGCFCFFFGIYWNVLPRTFLKAFEDPLMPPTFSLSISLHFIFTEFPSFFSKNYFLFCILLLNQKKQTSSAVLRYLEKSLKTRKSSVFFSWRLCGSYFTENQIHHRHFPGSFRQCPGHKKPLSSYFYQQQVLCTVCE